MTPDDISLPLLTRLHQRVFGSSEVRTVLDTEFSRLAAELHSRRDPPYVSGSAQVDIFTTVLPPALRSQVGLCRLFLLRRGCCMEVPEIHRNSIQRLVSYRGRGTIHAGEPGEGPADLVPRVVRSPGDEQADRYSASCGDQELARYWDVVPSATWHYPEAVAAGADWATVTFHSATEDEIRDELWTEAWPWKPRPPGL